ncbi:MAG TPA: hypothetical protein VFZ65_19555 [Planctomycetota bacterium]|nr:hypothetical protein [Planctomycetota bacterium]
MNRLLPLTIALLGSVLAAQTPPCISLNDGNNNVGTAITAFGFGGPGVIAYQFTPTTSLVLQAAEIYTASTPFSSPRGYMTLEIWDTNLIFLPQTRLGGGTWQNQPTTPLAPAWQGASFDQFVPLASGQTYWLVWRESGGNVYPYEPGGMVTPTARLSGGNWVLQAASQPIKWRGYCSLLDRANVVPIGLGCLTSQSKLPSEFTNNDPSIGNADFQIEATGFPAGSIGLAVLGTNAAWVSIPIPGAPAGCNLHTDPLLTATVFVGTGNEQAVHTTGASGHTWFDFPVPASPALAGTIIGSQFAVFDAALPDPLPFVFSNGLRFTLF